MNFVILKINGHDLSEHSPEQTLEAFRSAREPILVEVLRLSETSAITNNGSASNLYDTDDLLPYAVTKFDCIKPSFENMKSTLSSAHSIPPLVICPADENNKSNFLFTPNLCQQTQRNPLQRPRARLPFILSNDKDLALTDLEFDMTFPIRVDQDKNETDEEVEAFCNYEDLDKFSFQMEYNEITLARESAAEKLGLTLCYSPIGHDPDAFVNVFVSDVVTDSVAGHDGRIQKGDQLLRINGENIYSRTQAIRLIQSAVPLAALLLARPNLSVQQNDVSEETTASWRLDKFPFKIPTDMSSQQLTKTERDFFHSDSTIGLREIDSGVSSTQSSEQETIDDLAAVLHQSVTFVQYHPHVHQMQQLIPNEMLADKSNVSARPSVPRMGTRLRRVQEENFIEKVLENQQTPNNENPPLSKELTENNTNFTSITLQENLPNWYNCTKAIKTTVTATASSAATADMTATAASPTSPMEWVLKRRCDGSHYVARRPIRNQWLRERARRVAEERASMTTDDDAASQLGHWVPRNQRKCHLRRGEPMLNAVVDKTINEYENSVELKPKPTSPTAPLSFLPGKSASSKFRKSYTNAFFLAPHYSQTKKISTNMNFFSIQKEKRCSDDLITFV